MKSYRIEHSTTYTYEADVTASYGQFHLRPRDLGWQRCRSHQITVDPDTAHHARVALDQMLALPGETSKD